ncbi:hypothetical protein [Maritalea mediterranea]|uniref:Lipoprotein n=1 Tax=Maritalea mediterranea TaxID=2909667 RepID=A0ABS9ECX9_9HYPH|nr:hypothetical protein [Maritalea mediterranea]MCF4099749.1 hypothetical protein [Maritalea mediterranea]
MIFRHKFLFCLLTLAAILSFWSAAHIYFSVPIFFDWGADIRPINNMLGCAVLGIVVLSLRKGGKIKKDWLVDLLLLILFVASNFFGPVDIRPYIWFFGFSALVIPLMPQREVLHADRAYRRYKRLHGTDRQTAALLRAIRAPRILSSKKNGEVD